MPCNVRGGATSDLFRGIAIAGEPGDIAGQKLFLGGTCFDPQAGVFRDARDLVTLGKHKRLADSHHADRDAGGFRGRGISQIDAKIDGGGVAPEIGFRKIACAKNSGTFQLSRE